MIDAIPAQQLFGMEDEEYDWPELMATLRITKPAHQIVAADIVGKEMSSLNHWSLYYTYSRWKGFSVRNDKLRKDKRNKA